MTYANYPKFTGRNVPITELARATGKNPQFIRIGLQKGILPFGFVLLVLFHRVGVSSALGRLAYFDSVAAADLCQDIAFCCPPATYGVLALAVTHFFERLRQAVLCINSTFIVTDRYVVYVQVRCRFVSMEHGIEYIEVRVSLAESLHILGKALDSYHGIRRTNTCIILAAYLHNIFIEALTLVRSSYYIVARSMGERITEISVLDTAVGAFLPCIVTFNCLGKAFIISLCDRLFYKGDIVRSSGAVYIFRLKCAIVMGKAAFALTVRDSFGDHLFPFCCVSFSAIYHRLAVGNPLIPVTASHHRYGALRGADVPSALPF